MRSFEYGDREIGHRELGFAVASVMVGIGILTLPKQLAGATVAADGWISILIGGLITVFFVYIVAKLGARFPGSSLLDYTSAITYRPIAVVLCGFFSLHFLMFTAYESRMLSMIAKQYLFVRTPTEALNLVFLLVVVYAVAGSSVGLLRLNMLFFPFVLTIALAVQFMNIGFIDAENYFPVFESSWLQIGEGSLHSAFSFLGFEILLVYMAYANQPKKVPKAAMLGAGVTMAFYMVVYLFAIGVFGTASAAEIQFPTIEIAKEVEVPGEIFERFESIFFTVWIMTVFNTTSMAYDVALHTLRTLLPKIKRIHMIFVLTPLIYLVGMIPDDYIELEALGGILAYSSIAVGMFIPLILYIMAVTRGVGQR